MSQYVKKQYMPKLEKVYFPTSAADVKRARFIGPAQLIDLRSSRHRRAPPQRRRRIPRPRRAAGGIFAATTDNQLKAIDYSWNKASEGFAFHEIPDTVGDAAGALCVNAIRQGTGFYERIGRKITCRSLRIFGNLEGYVTQAGGDYAGTLSNPEAISVRMVLVYDRQPTGFLPAFSDIFASVNNKGGKTTSSFSSPLDLTKTGRFRVLRDKSFSLKPAVRDSIEHSSFIYQSVVIDEYIRFPNIETVFSTTADPPTVAQIVTGAIYLYFRASQCNTGEIEEGKMLDANNGYATFANGNIRLRYDDV